MTAVKLDSVRDGHASVTLNGNYIGNVERGEVAEYDRPGHVVVRTVWFAIPLARVAHAYPDGCPSFATRREAVAALADGVVLG